MTQQKTPAEALEAIADIDALFTDTEGEPSFHGSVGDLEVYREAMHRLRASVAALQSAQERPATMGVPPPQVQSTE